MIKFMKAIFYFSIPFIFSCTEQQDSKNNSVKQLTPFDTLKAKLIGQWGGLGEDVPVWEFRKDSVYYFQQSVAYTYNIINGDLVIYFPESQGVLKNIRVIKDTLFFLDEQGLKGKGFRFKK